MKEREENTISESAPRNTRTSADERFYLFLIIVFYLNQILFSKTKKNAWIWFCLQNPPNRGKNRERPREARRTTRNATNERERRCDLRGELSVTDFEFASRENVWRGRRVIQKAYTRTPIHLYIYSESV